MLTSLTEAKLKGASKSNEEVGAGLIAGESGNGVEVGESGCSITGTEVVGEGLLECALEDSAAATLARNLSSSVDFGLALEELLFLAL